MNSAPTYHRKHAIRLLHKLKRFRHPKPKRRGPKPVYHDEATRSRSKAFGSLTIYLAPSAIRFEQAFRMVAAPGHLSNASILATLSGRICIGKRKISLSRVSAGRYVGVTEIADDIWLVSFMDYDLGFFDNEVNRVEPVGEKKHVRKWTQCAPIFMQSSHSSHLGRFTVEIDPMCEQAPSVIVVPFLVHAGFASELTRT